MRRGDPEKKEIEEDRERERMYTFNVRVRDDDDDDNDDNDDEKEEEEESRGGEHVMCVCRRETEEEKEQMREKRGQGEDEEETCTLIARSARLANKLRSDFAREISSNVQKTAVVGWRREVGRGQKFTASDFSSSSCSSDFSSYISPPLDFYINFLAIPAVCNDEELLKHSFEKKYS